MVANGYGVTLVPEVSIDAKASDPRVKLLRFRDPEPGRSVGLAWRRTSPRADDFAALGEAIIAAHEGAPKRAPAPVAKARSRA